MGCHSCISYGVHTPFRWVDHKNGTPLCTDPEAGTIWKGEPLCSPLFFKLMSALKLQPYLSKIGENLIAEYFDYQILFTQLEN